MGKKWTDRLVRMLGRIFALCFLACLVWAALLYRDTLAVKRQQSDLIELHESAEAERAAVAAGSGHGAEFIDPLAQINPDYLGWLTVYGTQIDYSVVLGKDNDYYLRHDFYKNQAAAGCLFADCGVDPNVEGNLLIYGHHMRNGTMFGGLENFKDADFLDEHGLIRWERQGIGTYYEVFAVLVIPGYEAASDYFPIQDYLNEIDEAQTAELLSTLRDRASLWREMELNDTDQFLFLITCDYTRSDGRMLLCAKRLSR